MLGIITSIPIWTKFSIKFMPSAFAGVASHNKFSPYSPFCRPGVQMKNRNILIRKVEKCGKICTVFLAYK